MSKLTTAFALPSNGQLYSGQAVFTGLKMKHFKHLAMFSEPAISMATKFESALEVLSDCIKIEGLTDFRKLLGVDFDFLMLNMKIYGTPEQREFFFTWTCDCDDPDAPGHKFSMDTVFDLARLMESVKFWNGEQFFVNEYEFSFVDVGSWIEVYRLVEGMVRNFYTSHEEEVMKIIKEKLIEEDRVEYEKKRLLKRMVQFDEMNTMVEYRIAAHLKTKANLDLAAKKLIVDDMNFEDRQKLMKVIDEIEMFGVDKYIPQKCKNKECGKEVRILLPFRQLIKFI